MATQLDDDMLQRFYDGELTPVEARAVRSQIDHDPEAQRRLAQLGHLSDMLHQAAQDMGMGLDSAALFDGIEAGLKRDTDMGVGARLRVISSEWMEHKRGSLISLGAAVGIAAAALLAAIVPTAEDTTGVARSAPRPREERQQRLAVAAPAVGTEVHGSQIENVDFGHNTGTVFEIESEGVRTAVVWIADEEEDLP